MRGPIVRAASAVVVGASLTFSAAADAQIGAVASVYSDYRFRGISLSDGRPVAIVDLSYDLPSGIYAALSGRVVATKDEGPQPLGYDVNAGYAFRLRSSLSVDFGAVHSAYSHYSGLGAGRSYTEVYAGITGRLIGARLSVSPDYLGSAHWTVYAELDGHWELSRLTLIEGEIGALSPLGGSYPGSGHPQIDARLGVGHRVGPVIIHAALIARSRAYLYSTPSKGRTAFVIGVSTTL